MYDAQSLLTRAGSYSAGMFEADAMAWRPRPNKTKVVHGAHQGKQLAGPLDARKAAAGARLSEVQRRALAQARQRLSVTLTPVLAELIARQLRRRQTLPAWLSPSAQPAVPPGQIMAVARSTAEKLGLAVQDMLFDGQKSGLPPSWGGLAAMLFKLSAQNAGWPQAYIDSTAAGLAEAFDRSGSLAIKAFIAIAGVIAPQIFRGKRDAEFETLPIGSALELAA